LTLPLTVALRHTPERGAFLASAPDIVPETTEPLNAIANASKKIEKIRIMSSSRFTH
jgi:hypothetical protein